MPKIFCYCGREITFDDCDFETLNKYTYYCVRDSAVRTSQIPQINIARLLIFVPELHEPDHINRDGHDNRRNNLRIATFSQNMCNRNMPVSNTSGYIGVTWNKNRKAWRSYIYKDRQNIHLGYYESAIEAAKARDKKALELHGEFANLNFPN